MSSAWGKQLKYGDYEIVGASHHAPKLLGEGGFGKTYEAVRTAVAGHATIQEHVAIKVLNPDLLTSESKRQQFLAELFALTKFQHPNLIQYLSCGEQRGEVYYAMELCRGGDLLGMVRRFGPLPERAAAQICLQVATGLKQVHQKHALVHRDIKPSNIMLAEELAADLSREHMELLFEQQESLCRLVDFGLVDFALKAEYSPQRFVGTPMYASPEQIRGARADARSDIYSLGMTLWFLVQAKGPLLDEELREVRNMDAAMLQHAAPEEHQLPRHLSKAFLTVLARMVAKKPEARFGGAPELQSALREYLSQPADPNEIKFPLTRHPQSLDTMFDLGQRLYARGGRPAYEARERTTGRLVKLCVAANATGPSERVTALAGKLCKLAELSYEPLLPSSLAPVRSVIRAEDLLAYAEETQFGIGLPDLLKARGAAGRPIHFAEAVMLFYPIAHGLDFLLAHGRENVSLACDEVSLGGPTAASVPFETEALTLPLTDWNGLRVRFGLMPSPSSLDAADSSAPEMSVGGTIAGSMQMDSGDSQPLAAFARLIYRVLAGTEIPSLVQFAPDAYAPTVNLSSNSNRLIREVICRQRQEPTATEFLREMCTAETAPFRGPSHAAIARVIAPGRVKSPYAQGSPPQNIPENLWLPGREFICSASRRRVALPAELPPWEEPATPVEFHATPPPEESPADESSESIQQTVIALPGERSSSSRQSSQVVEKTPPPPAVPPKRSSKRWIIAVVAAIAVLAGAAVVYWKMLPVAAKAGSPSPGGLAFEGKTPGEVRIIAGLPFHWCPPTNAAGFTMGSPDSEEGRSADETRHSVVLTHGFWMAETNVTQGQWQTLAGTTLRQQAQKAFADDTRYGLPGKKQTIRERFAAQSVDQLIGIENSQIPIYWVNWDEASACCEQTTKSEHAAGRLPDSWVITLPTEAQWEYACRAGSTTATYAGDLNPIRRIVGSAPLIAPVLDPIAWYGANSGEGYQGKGFETAKWVERDLRFKVAGPHPAGTKNANGWGLKDMLGNVSAWCEDWYAGYSGDAETDPLGPGYGNLRGHRGGSWSATAAYCRAAARFRLGPRIHMRNVGLRLAVTPTRPQPQNPSKGPPPPQDSSSLEGDGSN